ncbi:MAG TPA: MFS transporter [Candidatus Dormibacteraeota bacterium]|nr:MFS transporter [Candidatus Dormibacteraeota bacterium]
MEAVGPKAASGRATGARARRAVWGAFLAFFVDNYDIFLPVIALAPAIAYFIPTRMPPATAAIVANLIFATTLIGRPLGAFVFGHLADTLGRRRGAIVSVAGFGVITLVIALLPGYAQWGMAATAVFIVLRLIDGIFLGGEYTAATPLAMEYAPKERRGLLGAVIQSAASLGTAAISLVTLLVLFVFPAGGPRSPYAIIGWRIPFFVGAAMAFALAFYYQRTVDESELWRAARRTDAPLRSLFSGANLRTFAQVFVLMSGFWLSLNATLSVLPGLLASRMGVKGSTLTFALVVAYLALAIVYVGAGALSQRIGRRAYLMGASLTSLVLGTSFYFLLLHTGPRTLLPVVVLTTIVVVLITAPGALSAVYLNERFKTEIRASGFGLGYSLAIVLPSFYAFYQSGLSALMPFIYTPLVLVGVGALLILAGAAWGPETKDVDFAAGSTGPAS